MRSKREKKKKKKISIIYDLKNVKRPFPKPSNKSFLLFTNSFLPSYHHRHLYPHHLIHPNPIISVINALISPH